MERHDRRRCLAERAGLDVMGKIGHDIAVHFQPDFDAGTAQSGMGLGAGIGVGKAADAADIAGKLQDFAVVDVVHHRFRSDAPVRA
jgi:hypothetical protein